MFNIPEQSQKKEESQNIVAQPAEPTMKCMVLDRKLSSAEVQKLRLKGYEVVGEEEVKFDLLLIGNELKIHEKLLIGLIEGRQI